MRENFPKHQQGPFSLRLTITDYENRLLEGIVVGLYLSQPDEKGNGKGHRKYLATLQTGETGYVSFKIDAENISLSEKLIVVFGTAETDAHSFETHSLLAGNDYHVVRLQHLPPIIPVQHQRFPAIMLPDARDSELAPGAIGLIPQLSPNSGLCGQLMPTTMTTHRFRAFQVIADLCKPEELDCSQQPDVQMVKGKILEYEVTWYPVGTSLGSLLNTFTLAPCEQVYIVIEDWVRKQSASRDESIATSQQSTSTTNHERLITESMNSLVKNRSFAASAASVSKATMALPIEKIKLDITSSIAHGASFSSSTQTAALNTTQNLSEYITQTASYAASQHSSVVFQSTTQEQRTYQSRRIGNPNPCHALTMMYYQVNHNYRVVTEYKGVRDVILIGYWNQDFDAHRAFCYAHLLKDALLNPAFASGFGLLADVLYCCDSGQDEDEQKVFTREITFSYKDLGGANPITMKLVLFLPNGTIDVGPVLTPQPNAGVISQTFTLPVPVEVTTITQAIIFFHMTGSMSFMVVGDVELTYKPDDGSTTSYALYSQTSSSTVRDVLVMPTSATLPPKNPDSNPCLQKSCEVTKLLAHLNCHKRYYNNLIWLDEDPNDRVSRWSCCDLKGTPFSLISQIENTPLTIYGDYVVFPAADSQLVDDPSILPIAKLITLPTSGVYAEGILGQCNACEPNNPDRPWDWEKRPCNCDTTGDSPSLPGDSGGIEPGDLKPDQITNSISFASLPSSPTSSIAEIFKTLLEMSDKGSADAKALLDKMFELLKESIKTPVK